MNSYYTGEYDFFELKDGTYAVEITKFAEKLIIPSEHNGKPVTVISVSEKASGRNNVKEIIIPDSVSSIEKCAFAGCSSLVNIEIPNSVTSIGEDAFDNCDSLVYNEFDTAKYLGNKNNPFLLLVKESAGYMYCNIHSDTKIIYAYAFAFRERIKEIIIPDGVTSIGAYAFCGCKSLKSITIPNSVTSIGDRAFHGCKSLKSVTIPNSVTSIGKWAFYGCTALTIYCEAASKPEGWNSSWNPDNRPVIWGASGD